MSNQSQYCQTQELTQKEWFELYQKTKQERDEAISYLKWIETVAENKRAWILRDLAREGLTKAAPRNE